MRATIHIIATVILLGSLSWWWRAGAHTGWTKTSVQVWKYDEVTEISYPETVKRFVPGVDLLAGAAGLSVALGAGAFLIRRRKTQPGPALPS